MNPMKRPIAQIDEEQRELERERKEMFFSPSLGISSGKPGHTVERL